MKKTNYNKIWENDIPDWDKEQLWSRIESNIENKKDRSFLLMILFVFFLAGVSAVLWFYNQKISETTTDLANNVTKNKTVKSSENINSSNKNTEITPESYHSKSQLNHKKYKKNQYRSNYTDQKFKAKSWQIDENVVKNSFGDSSENDLIESNAKIEQRVLDGFLQLPIDKKYITIETRKSLTYKNNIINVPFKKEFFNDKTAFFSAMTGLGFVVNRSKFDKNPVWQNRKHNNEKVIYTYSLSIQYGKSIYRNIFISSGFDYHNKIVNFIDKDSIVTVNNFQSDSAYVAYLATSEYFSGDKTKTNIKYRSLNVYNQISHIYLPINIGYRHVNQKNGFMISTGVLFRLFSKFKGYSISNENNIIQFGDYKNSLRRYTGITDFRLAGSCWIKLFRNFNLTLGFETVLPIKPSYSLISNDAIQYSDRTIILNSQLGFTYSFQ